MGAMIFYTLGVFIFGYVAGALHTLYIGHHKGYQADNGNRYRFTKVE